MKNGKRKIILTPYSSVVGQSVQVIDERGVVALISIMVPQPHIDYKSVAIPLAQEIIKALE